MPSAKVYSALVTLSDPATRPADPAAFQLNGREVDSLLKLADRHTVLPAVLANLKKIIETGASATSVEPKTKSKCSGGTPKRPYAWGCGHDDHPQTKQPFGGATQRESYERYLGWADSQILLRIGLTLALRRQLSQIGAALAARNLPACVLKGAEFADRLYPSPALRPFTDIDLLVPETARGEVEKVMAGLGYQPQIAAMKHATGYGEQSWRPPTAVGGTVEVHWNLVNSPTLRRRVSVRFEDLRLDSAGPAASWGLPRPDGSSLLLIAAVHAAASHCFDRLQMLWDVCQSARSAAGPLDEAWLADAARRTGGRLAMATALHLVDRVLGEPAAGRLLDRLSLGRPSLLVRSLLTRSVILRGHAGRDSIRRQIFRERLKRT